MTAHPSRIPPKIAQTNFRSGESNVKFPSNGQLSKSKHHLAPYVYPMAAKNRKGTNANTTTAAILIQSFWIFLILLNIIGILINLIIVNL